MNTLTEVEQQRAEVLAVLEEFKLPVSYFDKLSNTSLEKHAASISAQRLRELYLRLLQPGVSIKEVSAECPPWPKGHRYAGGHPSSGILYVIRQRLILERTKADGVTQRTLAIREKELQLRQAAKTAEPKKIQPANDGGKTAEPQSQPRHETVDEMFIRIFGKKILPD